ncbi:DNA polymerase III subunit alpha [Chryseosolibacter indicus]|uniref:DNA-directed DNA polymerase n=1 Tax=Chryseosolibacter indicus TaxID=2782351 RepID=A0ABS5VQZ2_9BACT|nr:DNA polymerase III subunit alpha [Chryseosolibacter indicus]MBT1703250.1 DNA polymerase III subunit alpha [Chryseosolibacter indicus]
MFLNCHTGFSFKYGTLPVQRLFDEAKRCGVHKLVLTEINNTASYMEMLRIRDKNIPGENGLTKYGDAPYQLDIAVGIEFRRDDELLYIAIAKNNQGFKNINKFLSYHNREAKPLPLRAPAFDEVFTIYPWGKIEPEQLKENEYIGVHKQQLHYYNTHPLKSSYQNKFVIHHPVTFLPPENPKTKNKKGEVVNRDYNAHRLLRAIAHNTLLSKLAEHQRAASDEYMIPEEELKKNFERYPELIKNTQWLINQCSIEQVLGKDKNRQFYTESLEDDLLLLKTEAWKGFDVRYGHHPDKEEIKKRIRKELRIIREKKFTAYYLITYDLIKFAKSQGYEFVGRGSGANSTVAYCLGITNVDPIELNLYFERFLNEERSTPPDFDIDFSWDNRDAIYNYIFERYGYDHVCLLGTHVTYQWRSILRELGKVFGLPKDEIDALVENPKRISERDHITKLIFNYSKYIVEKELPSNISIHAGGVLITEKPIYAYTATEFPPKGYPVSQFEMHNAEDFGIYKFDILSQRGLGHIKETIAHVKRTRGIDVDINRFEDFKKDEKIKALLRNSKAMGCFYVESPAMRMLLGKLKCEDYLTLVAASSIIRPGVASSGMMRAYIERFHAVRNGRTYEAIHPKIDELMKETYGVMVYQEDVIKVAHEFAGITLTEADVLRRGMSGKYRSREEFKKVRDRFFEECHKRHYEQHIIDRVWYEIESFSGYSFAKGHSASYAVESYQSLYLKAHYPLEFMVGVINNFGGFYKTEFYFHEARMNGAKIEAPCINNSEYLTTIYDDHIYIGFVHIKSLESKLAQEISLERKRNGLYQSIDNLLKRINIGVEQLRILVRIGALRFTGKSKQQLLWEAMLHFSNKHSRKNVSSLFETEPKDYPLPALTRKGIEDAFDEIELLGFPLCDPFELVDAAATSDTLAEELMKKVGTHVTIDGYLVTTKDTRTRGGQTMQFGTFIDRKGNVFDTVHFPDVTKNFPFRGRGFYAIKGSVVEDFGVAMVEVTSMEKLPIINKRAEEFMREHSAFSPPIPQQQD